MEISFCSDKHRKAIDGEKGGTYSDLNKIITKKHANCEAEDVLMVYDALKAAKNLSELPKSFRFHALSGNRNEEYAVNINNKYRMTFKIIDDNISKDRLLFANKIEITDILVDYH